MAVQAQPTQCPADPGAWLAPPAWGDTKGESPRATSDRTSSLGLAGIWGELRRDRSTLPSRSGVHPSSRGIGPRQARTRCGGRPSVTGPAARRRSLPRRHVVVRLLVRRLDLGLEFMVEVAEGRRSRRRRDPQAKSTTFPPSGLTPGPVLLGGPSGAAGGAVYATAVLFVSPGPRRSVG